MGESRTELLAWVNDLLQLNYTKVEQVGTGAAYCQIMDSIFNDVHLNKVKFETKHEYDYVANFKVLQHTFDKHKVDKIIPVEKLVKCKFQDNLEFMQWMKRYWDHNYQGGEYDAIQCRKSGGGSMSAMGNPVVKSVRANNGSMARKSPAVVMKNRNAPISRLSSTKGETSLIQDLTRQMNELKVTVDGLEKERDFYFGKLREIEIIVQEQIDMEGETACLRDIQSTLYRTEDGFEVPPEGAAEIGDAYEDDDETF